jgi:acyl-CoA thioesterase-2
MATALDNLLELLDLEELEVNIFRGRSPQEGWQRVFGGQVLGQALVAATRTVEEERVAHSLHGYFLRPGDPTVPILYDVDRIRDGRSFTTRRVVAIQRGRAIFNMSVSFQREESGLEHQIDMPYTPDPESLPSYQERMEAFAREEPELAALAAERERRIEPRSVAPHAFMGSREKHPPYQRIWFRAAGRLPESLAIHQCVLAYASDYTLLDTSTLPHGVTFWDGGMQSASLDHAMWFHRRFRADEWLLYVQDSPAAAGARGFNRGTVYSRKGELVASVAQEGLIRMLTRD